MAAGGVLIFLFVSYQDYAKTIGFQLGQIQIF